ncbi:MAG: lysophospholipid acyltransferase family protein [Prevotella sp.]|nr:lysophospholipid acyltransferase family protein [Prevotella sp.]
MYYVLFAVWYLFSLLPFRVHYCFSDLLYVLIYHVAGYRKKVVRQNLASSFPEKSAEELRRTERDFYHWFCDYMVETVKMFSISEQNMRRRMVFEGMEQVADDARRGRSVSIYLGHYCNWEWISSLPLHVPADVICAQLYHPIENKVMNRLFLYSRGRCHAHSVEMLDAFRQLAAWKKEGKVTITGYIADQVPGFGAMHYWPWFLNHDTPAYTGGERIARILDTSVYYLDIHRPRRGYYVAKVIKICDDTKQLPKFGVTEQYFRLLEQSIRRAPGLWLWSHNRWKRTREQFNAEFSEEERKRILSKL